MRGSRVAAPGSTDYVTIAAGAVGTTELSAAAVTTAKLGAAAVTFAQAKASVSAEQTGTGAPQNVAHGLGAAPAAVLIAVTDDVAALLTGFTVVEGVHDGTNVVVTVTTGVKYKVFCWA